MQPQLFWGTNNRTPLQPTHRGRIERRPDRRRHFQSVSATASDVVCCAHFREFFRIASSLATIRCPAPCRLSVQASSDGPGARTLRARCTGSILAFQLVDREVVSPRSGCRCYADTTKAKQRHRVLKPARGGCPSSHLGRVLCRIACCCRDSMRAPCKRTLEQIHAMCFWKSRCCWS